MPSCVGRVHNVHVTQPFCSYRVILKGRFRHTTGRFAVIGVLFTPLKEVDERHEPQRPQSVLISSAGSYPLQPQTLAAALGKSVVSKELFPRERHDYHSSRVIGYR